MATRRLTGPAHKFAVCARRGGVGKSNVTWNIGSELAMLGFKVAMLEVEDSPRLFRMAIGADEPDDRLTIFRLFTTPEDGLGASPFTINMAALSREIGVITGDPKKVDLEDMKDELTPKEVQELIARRTWYAPSDALAFVPGSKSLQLIDNDNALAQRSAHRVDFDPYTQLHRAIQRFERDFDFIIMDTPPSLNLVQVNAAIAADYLVFVVTFDPDSDADYREMERFHASVNMTASQIGAGRTQVAGVVYNMYRESGRGARTHKTLYKRYTSPWIDEAGVDHDAIVRFPELARIPFDQDHIEGAMQARRPMCVYAPVSPIGTIFYTLAHNVALTVGAVPALAR